MAKYIYDRFKGYSGHRVQFRNRKMSRFAHLPGSAVKVDDWDIKFKEITGIIPIMEKVDYLITDHTLVVISDLQDNIIKNASDYYKENHIKLTAKTVERFFHKYVNHIVDTSVSSWMDTMHKYWRSYDDSSRVEEFMNKVSLDGWMYAVFTIYWHHCFHKSNINRIKDDSMYGKLPLCVDSYRSLDDRMWAIERVGMAMSELILPSNSKEIVVEISEELTKTFKAILGQLVKNDTTVINFDKFPIVKEFVDKYNKIDLFS